MKTAMSTLLRDQRGAVVMPQEHETPRADHDGAAETPLIGRVLKSQDLLCGSKEVLITHRGELYRLRETKNGKLLLLK